MLRIAGVLLLLAAVGEAAIVIQAEDGEWAWPMEKSSVGGVTYVGSNPDDCSIKDPDGQRAGSNEGYVAFPFSVQETSLVAIESRILTPDSLSDSFWSVLDGVVRKWETGRHAVFGMELFAPAAIVNGKGSSMSQRCFLLAPGRHTFSLYVREPGAAVDVVRVVNPDPLIIRQSEGCSGGCDRGGGSVARFRVSNLCGPELASLINITVGGRLCTDVAYESDEVISCRTPPVDGEGRVFPVTIVQYVNAAMETATTLHYQPPIVQSQQGWVARHWYVIVIAVLCTVGGIGARFVLLLRGEVEKGRPPPTGLLALVFLSVHESTTLWEKHGKVLKEAYAVYNAILREHIDTNNGYGVKTEGDVRLLAFDTVMDAARFCCQVQLALVEAPWSEELLQIPQCAEHLPEWRGLRVSMGIHYGEPTLQQNSITRRMDYFGPVVNRTARVHSLAHGGMILMTNEAKIALNDELCDEDMRTSPHYASVSNPTFPDNRSEQVSEASSEGHQVLLLNNSNDNDDVRSARTHATESWLTMRRFRVGKHDVDQIFVGHFTLRGISRPQRLHMLVIAPFRGREFPAINTVLLPPTSRGSVQTGSSFTIP